MSSTLKLYGGIALLVLLMLAGWAIKHWDNQRMDAQYKAGETAERGKWTDARELATAQAVAKGNSDTRISEGVADQARTDAGTTTAASTAANHTIVEKIDHAYAVTVTPQAHCGPGPGTPAALPDGVLDALREARSNALGQAAAAPGGLQPAQRSGSTVAPADHQHQGVDHLGNQDVSGARTGARSG